VKEREREIEREKREIHLYVVKEREKKREKMYVVKKRE
jgi:hypothetical protein